MNATKEVKSWRDAERVKAPPVLCPRCQWIPRGSRATRWQSYRVIDEAPAAGCGNCGYIVLLTEPYHMIAVSEKQSEAEKI
jgi:hypothetical protein